MINIDDYISEEQKAEIAEQEFRRICVDKYKSDHERIFGNVAMNVVRKMVDEEMSEDLTDLIKKKVLQNIKTLSSYTVFSPKSNWEKESTGGFEAIKEAINENKDVLESRVKELMLNINNTDVREMILDHMHEILFNALPDKDKND